ncbi:hypothetical protein [Burkholderia lata]|uniref:Uncharacterized protein n=1 Tax=Burkholderia lata (strain ATCC 17760 / DSM 23089 / LMG 22485 / NCIMB 9086 / R18194 / 383) TaxID=482957 RepID=A0A6P2RGV0_BURL3|nr:hypothetical protein [Burkholderia lata]VWC32284.1 hypothetical protein BLA6863_06489 [Burkholderia lata]
MLIDEAPRHLEAPRRESADALVGLLAPVVKDFFTDNGRRAAAVVGTLILRRRLIDVGLFFQSKGHP